MKIQGLRNDDTKPQDGDRKLQDDDSRLQNTDLRASARRFEASKRRFEASHHRFNPSKTCRNGWLKWRADSCVIHLALGQKRSEQKGHRQPAPQAPLDQRRRGPRPDRPPPHAGHPHLPARGSLLRLLTALAIGQNHRSRHQRCIVEPTFIEQEKPVRPSASTSRPREATQNPAPDLVRLSRGGTLE